MSTENQKSFFDSLWDRRFFQYLASYLVGAWGIIQCIDWLVKRYQYSSSWTDICFFFLLSLLPSVMAFIYNHGKPGNDKWTKFEKRLIRKIG